MVIGVRNDNLMYNWTKDNGTAQSVVSTSSTLFFSPLKLSDAGQYLCKVMIGSQMYGAMEYINIESMSIMLEFKPYPIMFFFFSSGSNAYKCH